MRPLFKRSAILFVLSIFVVIVSKAQNSTDSPRTTGIQFGAMVHNSIGFSVEMYRTLDWPPSKREVWNSAGLQYTRTAFGRNRYMPKWGFYHNLLELENGMSAGAGLGFLFVLADANGLDLVRDIDKFIENANFILPLEIFVSFGQFNLGYQYNLIIQEPPFVDYPGHAVSIYYRLKLGEIGTAKR